VKIYLNGEPMDILSGTTVAGLVALLDLAPEQVAVESDRVPLGQTHTIFGWSGARDHPLRGWRIGVPRVSPFDELSPRAESEK
jgi:hypothetical protein